MKTNMQLNKNSNQIEGKDDDLCNFSDEQVGNLNNPTPNFELELAINLKELASTDILKKNGINQSYIYPHIYKLRTNHHDHDRSLSILPYGNLTQNKQLRKIKYLSLDFF